MLTLQELKNGISKQITQIENYDKKESFKWTYKDSKQYLQFEHAYTTKICELIACIRWLLNKK